VDLIASNSSSGVFILIPVVWAEVFGRPVIDEYESTRKRMHDPFHCIWSSKVVPLTPSARSEGPDQTSNVPISTKSEHTLATFDPGKVAGLPSMTS
jgi:hypothetical protein